MKNMHLHLFNVYIFYIHLHLLDIYIYINNHIHPQHLYINTNPIYLLSMGKTSPSSYIPIPYAQVAPYIQAPYMV
jgi:hypothetical protein